MFLPIQELCADDNFGTEILTSVIVEPSTYVLVDRYLVDINSVNLQAVGV